MLGWSERALHLAFLLPAVAAVLGAYALARELCSRPFLAALIVALSPVFLFVRQRSHVRHDDAGLLGLGHFLLGPEPEPEPQGPSGALCRAGIPLLFNQVLWPSACCRCWRSMR